MASITKRGDKYRIRVFVGTDSTGKKLFESTTFEPTLNTEKQRYKEAELFALQFEEQVKNDISYQGNKMSFQQLADSWLENYATLNIGLNTRESYLSIIRSKSPELFQMKVNDIKPASIQSAVSKMIRNGNTPGTARRYLYAVSSILNYGFKMSIVKENVCRRIIIPTKKATNKKEIHFFSTDQMTRFLTEALNLDMVHEYRGHKRTLSSTGECYEVKAYKESRAVSNQFKALFYLTILGGFRKGETLALTWNDIDFENHRINISKSVSLTHSQGSIIKEPKSNAGFRVVTLPSICFDMLKAWKKDEIDLSFELGSAWQGYRGKDFDKNWIFIQMTNGNRMHSDTPYTKFKSIISNYNKNCADESKKLPDIRFHDLRHTNGTYLFANGIDAETIKTRLGHADIVTTLKYYIHATDENDTKAVELLSKISV